MYLCIWSGSCELRCLNKYRSTAVFLGSVRPEELILNTSNAVLHRNLLFKNSQNSIRLI